MNPTVRPQRKRIAITVNDEANIKPKLDVAWSDFVAKHSPVRDQVIEHYPLVMAPWGIVAAAFGGLIVGLGASDVASFVQDGWSQPALDYALFTLNLGFIAVLVYLVSLVVLRSIAPIGIATPEGSRYDQQDTVADNR